MAIDRIFPNFRSVTFGDLQQGDLILDHAYGKVSNLCLIVKPLVKDESLLGVVSLFPEWELKILHSNREFVGYKILNDWRMRLDPILPNSFKSSPLDAPIGNIAVCERARMIVCREQEGFGGCDLKFVDIDQTKEIDEPVGSNKCFYSKWVIQICGEDSGEWKDFYNPFESGTNKRA